MDPSANSLGYDIIFLPLFLLSNPLSGPRPVTLRTNRDNRDVPGLRALEKSLPCPRLPGAVGLSGRASPGKPGTHSPQPLYPTRKLLNSSGEMGADEGPRREQRTAVSQTRRLDQLVPNSGLHATFVWRVSGSWFAGKDWGTSPHFSSRARRGVAEYCTPL